MSTTFAPVFDQKPRQEGRCCICGKVKKLHDPVAQSSIDICVDCNKLSDAEQIRLYEAQNAPAQKPIEVPRAEEETDAR